MDNILTSPRARLRRRRASRRPLLGGLALLVPLLCAAPAHAIGILFIDLPAATTVCSGSPASISVTIKSGNPPYRYQWLFERPGTSNFLPIGGAASQEYDFTPQLSDDGGQFQVRVTDSDSQTATATTTLQMAPLSFIQCVPAVTIPIGANCQPVPIPDLTKPPYGGWQLCGVGTVSLQDPPAGTLVGMGPHTVTLTARGDDTYNPLQHATCDTTVTVVDPVAPHVSAPLSAADVQADPNCQGEVPDIVPEVRTSVRCDGDVVTVSQDPAAGTLVDVGTHTITITATNLAGARSTATTQFSVVALRLQLPCPAGAGSTIPADPGQCSASGVNPTPPTATGGCGTVTVVGTRSDVRPLTDPYPVGKTTITWTATDGANDQASCPQTITVADMTPPTLMNVPPSIPDVPAAGGCQGSVPDVLNQVTASTTCGQAKLSQNPPAGTLVGLGPQTITITATNSSGVSSTATVPFSVIVLPLKLACPSADAEKAIPADPGQCSASGVNPTPPTATGGCGTITVVGTRLDEKPLTAPYLVGKTTITWTATDGNNDQATCQQTITVADQEPPALNCPQSEVVTMSPGKCYGEFTPVAPTATDNCSTVTVTGTRSDNQPLTAPYPDGDTVITWTATDASSNQFTCKQTISVVDIEPPTLAGAADETVAAAPGQCAAVLTVNPPTATDNCGSATVTGMRSDSKALTDPYPVGDTIITWVAIDSHAIPAELEQTITVQDTELPVITCPASKIVSADPGQCTATVLVDAPAASDNCGAPTVTGQRSDSQSLDAAYPVGTTTITWTATDAASNQATCTQSIIVNGTEAPTLTGASASPALLWPPDGQVVPVTIDYTATDTCSAVTTTLSASNNETGGADAVVVDAHHVLLRAARAGAGSGRVYTITITGTNASGKVTQSAVTVTVPHSQ